MISRIFSSRLKTRILMREYGGQAGLNRDGPTGADSPSQENPHIADQWVLSTQSVKGPRMGH